MKYFPTKICPKSFGYNKRLLHYTIIIASIATYIAQRNYTLGTLKYTFDIFEWLQCSVIEIDLKSMYVTDSMFWCLLHIWQWRNFVEICGLTCFQQKKRQNLLIHCINFGSKKLTYFSQKNILLFLTGSLAFWIL